MAVCNVAARRRDVDVAVQAALGRHGVCVDDFRARRDRLEVRGIDRAERAASPVNSEHSFVTCKVPVRKALVLMVSSPVGNATPRRASLDPFGTPVKRCTWTRTPQLTQSGSTADGRWTAPFSVGRLVRYRAQPRPPPMASAAAPPGALVSCSASVWTRNLSESAQGRVDTPESGRP